MGGDAVVVENSLISAQESQTAESCLSDEHPVEGVAVIPPKGASLECRFHPNAQKSYTLSGQAPKERADVEGELAGGDLYGQFPH